MSRGDSGPSRREVLEMAGAIAALNAAGSIVPAAATGIVTTTIGTAGTSPISAARYVLRRLKQHGCTTLFGVPGKTCETLYKAAAREGVALCITASDLEAGYAADGYARTKGLGAVAVTYGPGTLSLVNAIAGAFTEESPVLLINGGPSEGEVEQQRQTDVRFTHSIGRAGEAASDALTDLAVFRAVTGHARRITSGSAAAAQIDEAFVKAVTRQRPVYLELAKTVWDATLPGPATALDFALRPAGLEAAQAATLLRRLASAAKPLMLLGIEIARCGLADQVTSLLARLEVPWATTLLSKSVLDERTPGFVGVYEGLNASPTVKRVIDEADQILMLGTVLGVWHRHLVDPPRDRIVRAGNGQLRVGTAAPVATELGALVDELQRGPWSPSAAQRQTIRGWRDRMQLSALDFDHRRRLPRRTGSATGTDAGLTYDELMGTVSDQLDAQHVVITDTTLAMYQAGELDVKGRASFLCNSVWQSIGFSVGASVGVGIALKDQGTRRPFVICGDGGFQMMAQGLSTLVRQRIRAIVLIVDNGTYGIEQHLIDGSYFGGTSAPIPFVTLNRWRYADLARAMGVATAFEADTVAKLKDALAQANAATGPAVISVKVRQHDRPSELG